ncbi:hypothetical protein K1T71_003612 [Dendrolimus kikuchii]|uniref:Uncharacterized protein n=1 Tax=Dendrolimus kikuchii TaxID=765133 RepID=A0ACC1D9E8_9NEOP|nr:hypothetical protein K1T71_003612 [Dendrolimus kikuchii]
MLTAFTLPSCSLFHTQLSLPYVSVGTSTALSDTRLGEQFRLKRNHRNIGAIDLPSGCLYEGRWFTDGSIVSTKEACLRCVCNRGALACTRRACSRLPEPPPKRCHVLHRKGSCCPELHCPDGVILLEQSASARFENEDYEDGITASANVFPACVEGGTIYAAGSAMSSSTACEQCFCLGGGRRCVRPQCMPTPQDCSARPSPGACCPQRYYCERTSTRPPEERHQYDCQVNGKWIIEGDKVNSIEKTTNCSQCFCLRGVVQCQPLTCAQPLMGCQPLLRPGDCCPHRYHCNHRQGPKTSNLRASFNPYSIQQGTEDMRSTKSKMGLTTKNAFTDKDASLTSTLQQLISTTKVKRKTNELPREVAQLNNFTITSITPKAITSRAEAKATNITPKIGTTKMVSSEVTLNTITSGEGTTEITDKNTEQPEGTIRIMINGTINCTSELSSTSIPSYDNFSDTERINMETQPRIPLIDTSDLDVTFSPNDIITDRSVSNFDENETFTINVTSSLRTNTTVSTKRPTSTVPVSKIVPTSLTESTNSSKKTKEDYDYDYTEPTLPPSLPNLKIIPFVAADAVVDEEAPKADMTYPSLDRNDKFPVYYPNVETKDQVYPTRKADVYNNPTQYPVFVSGKVPHYSVIEHINDMISYSNNNDQEHAPFDGKLPDTNRIMKATTRTFELETPAVNMFSPPQETEGGFVPKDPSLIDDYYAVYSSTSPSSILSVPHLTTSMQLDISKGECTSSEGHRVAEGTSIVVACSECRCLWGEIRCSPRLCPKPLQCTTTLAQDPCCEPLICPQDNDTTEHTISTDKKNITKVYATSSTEAPRTITPPKQTNETRNTTDIKFNKKPNDIHNKEVTNRTNMKMTTTTPKTTQTTSSRPTKKPITYEEDDEEEFSLGSVLKLLLREYETTTLPTITKPPITRPTRKPLPTVAPFIPLPTYTPPKLSVNRIDHLILGESSAISTSTPASLIKVTTRTTPTTRTTTRTTTKIVNDEPKEVHYSSNEVTKSSTISGVPGLLKLAGCNIYGRMYRVGRIITELSTPCQECWCTELGVQCKSLKC